MEVAQDICALFEEPEAPRRGCVESDAIGPDEEFVKDLTGLAARGAVLIGLFCVQDFENHQGFSLHYVLEKRGSPNVVVLRRPLSSGKTCSVARVYPSACWFEREIRDGFGVDFVDAFDKRRLFLHECYPQGFHPLVKEFNNGPVSGVERIDPKDEYRFKELEGEGVYQIPVGPVHAGIIEPGHFRFSVIGETIFNLEVRMFYKHRGIEKLAEGKTIDQCMPVAESISGDESVANSVAFAMAAETLSSTTAPPRAWALRTVLLEMERIYSHLGDMAGMIVDVAFPKGASPFFILREDVLRQNEALTGSRFMKGIVCPGGLNRDIEDERLELLSAFLSAFSKRFETAVAKVKSVSSVVDRLETTGVIKPELSGALNITGPGARASGVPVDTRCDHPYGLYREVKFARRLEQRGDVMARFNVKSAEVLDSVSMIAETIAGMPRGGVCHAVKPVDGHALSLVEAPRGQSMHWLNVREGLVDRYKVRTPSFCNWQAIEHAVLGNIVPDFPLINKSLNLSYAGTDL